MFAISSGDGLVSISQPSTAHWWSAPGAVQCRVPHQRITRIQSCFHKNGLHGLTARRSGTWPQVGPLSSGIRTALNPPGGPEGASAAWGASVALPPAERLEQPPAGGRHRLGWDLSWNWLGPWPPPWEGHRSELAHVRERRVESPVRRAFSSFSHYIAHRKVSAPEAYGRSGWKGLLDGCTGKAGCASCSGGETANAEASYAPWPLNDLAGLSVLACGEAGRPDSTKAGGGR